MTFVVTENCIKCKYMDCVEVCPVDCFHEGPNFLAIALKLATVREGLPPGEAEAGAKAQRGPHAGSFWKR